MHKVLRMEYTNHWNLEAKFQHSRGAFTYDEAKPTPPEYRVHMEWGSPSDAMFGIGRVLLAHPAREIHDKVLDTLIRGPYIRLLNPMMEEQHGENT